MRTPNFFRQIDPRFDGNQHIFLSSTSILRFCRRFVNFQTYAVPQRMAEITSVSAAAMISLAAASACWPVTPAGSPQAARCAFRTRRTPLSARRTPGPPPPSWSYQSSSPHRHSRSPWSQIAVLDRLGRMRVAWKNGLLKRRWCRAAPKRLNLSSCAKKARRSPFH